MTNSHYTCNKISLIDSTLLVFTCYNNDDDDDDYLLEIIN